MQVKSPMCVVFGIVCSLCFVVCIAQGKDLFTIVFCLFAAVMNFIAGIGGNK